MLKSDMYDSRGGEEVGGLKLKFDLRCCFFLFKQSYSTVKLSRWKLIFFYI